MDNVENSSFGLGVSGGTDDTSEPRDPDRVQVPQNLLRSEALGVTAVTELQNARLERRLEELTQRVDDIHGTWWGRRVPLAFLTAIISVLGTLLAAEMATASKDRELALEAERSKGQLAQKDREGELERQKYERQIVQEYLKYTMSDKGGDPDFQLRLLDFLRAVETEPKITNWASRQRPEVERRRQQSIDEANAKLEAAEQQRELAKTLANRLQGRLNGQSKQLESRDREIESLTQSLLRAKTEPPELAEARRLVRSQQSPSCKPGTRRAVFGGTEAECGEVPRSAYLNSDTRSWTWVVAKPGNATSTITCACNAT